MIPFYKLCVCTKSGNIGQHLEAYLVVTNMKAGGAAKHLTTHRTASPVPPNKNYQALTVNIAKVEKPKTCTGT